MSLLYQNCSKTPVNRVYWRVVNGHFVGSAVELHQGFAFHRQLYLRVFREHAGVPLSQKLDDPFIRNSAGTHVAETLELFLFDEIRMPHLSIASGSVRFGRGIEPQVRAQ